jgi:hypothetical protein
LLRIDVDPNICAALAHLGYARNSFVKDRVLVVDDIFFHLRIVDDLATPKGFRFVFYNTFALTVTPPRVRARRSSLNDASRPSASKGAPNRGGAVRRARIRAV